MDADGIAIFRFTAERVADLIRRELLLADHGMVQIPMGERELMKRMQDRLQDNALVFQLEEEAARGDKDAIAFLEQAKRKTDVIAK